MQAACLSARPSFCLRLPHPLHYRHHHMDSWLAVELHMPVLFLRDDHSGVCARVDQGAISCDGVVHLQDSLLVGLSCRVLSFCKEGLIREIGETCLIVAVCLFFFFLFFFPLT